MITITSTSKVLGIVGYDNKLTNFNLALIDIKEVYPSGDQVHIIKTDSTRLIMKYDNVTLDGTVYGSATLLVDALTLLIPIPGAGAAPIATPRFVLADNKTTGTITIRESGLGLESAQIQSILVTKADNTAILYRQANGDYAFFISGDIISIYQNGVIIDTLLATDTSYLVGYIGHPIGTDPSSQSIITSNETEGYTHNLSPQHIDEDNKGAQNTTYYSRTAIQCGNFNHLSFSYLITADDTHNDVTLKVYGVNKAAYSLPATDTAIADTDEIENISEEILGYAAGISVNNGSALGIEVIDIPTKFYAFIIEIMYVEDNTAAPGNAADIHYIQYS